MKVMTSLILFFVLLRPAFAQGESIKELAQRFQYTVEVEWDQKEPEFLAQAQRDLDRDIEALLASGVSARELLEGATVLHREPTADELRKAVMESLQEGEKGASWNGVGYVAVGVVGTIAVLYIATRIYFHEWGKRL